MTTVAAVLQTYKPLVTPSGSLLPLKGSQDYLHLPSSLMVCPVLGLYFYFLCHLANSLSSKSQFVSSTPSPSGCYSTCKPLLKSLSCCVRITCVQACEGQEAPLICICISSSWHSAWQKEGTGLNE